MEWVARIALENGKFQDLLTSNANISDEYDRTELLSLFKNFFDSSSVCEKFLKTDAVTILMPAAALHPIIIEFLLEKGCDVQKIFENTLLQLLSSIRYANLGEEKRFLLLSDTVNLVLNYALDKQIMLTTTIINYKTAINSFLHYYDETIYSKIKKEWVDKFREILCGLIVLCPPEFFIKSRVLKPMDLKTICYFKLAYEDFVLLEEFSYPVINLKFEFNPKFIAPSPLLHHKTSKDVVYTFYFSTKVNKFIFTNIQSIMRSKGSYE